MIVYTVLLDEEQDQVWKHIATERGSNAAALMQAMVEAILQAAIAGLANPSLFTGVSSMIKDRNPHLAQRMDRLVENASSQTPEAEGDIT